MSCPHLLIRVFMLQGKLGDLQLSLQSDSRDQDLGEAWPRGPCSDKTVCDGSGIGLFLHSYTGVLSCIIGCTWMDAWLTHAAHTNLRLKRLTRKEGPLASWPRMTRMVRHWQLLSAGCNRCARVSLGKSWS